LTRSDRKGAVFEERNKLILSSRLVERSRPSVRSSDGRRDKSEPWEGIVVSVWQVLFWSAAVVGVPAALHGLHRLGLWLEDRGHIYYLRNKPRGSAAGCFVAIQRAIEPQAQHVLQVREESSRDAADTTGPRPFRIGD
jgi:hypothetical protein